MPKGGGASSADVSLMAGEGKGLCYKIMKLSRSLHGAGAVEKKARLPALIRFFRVLRAEKRRKSRLPPENVCPGPDGPAMLVEDRRPPA